MQDSQTNNEQERNEQYQKQIREWGQVDEKIEQRGTEASNTQACDRNASVQSNDGSPQDDGRELPPRESASLFKENEDMTNSYANDGFSKRQNAKQWGGRANLAQENRGRKMFPERNGLNATTDISSDSANWNQQAGTSNRHRSNDDRNKFQKGQQKYFDRGDEDAVKPASKARSRERGGYRSEHPASMHGQRLVREVTKSTVQGDRMNFTDNDRDSGNRYYSEARSARRKNEEWSHDKGGDDENGNLSAQDKRQLAAWNVGSENENDNCMQ
ncbi:unnamed protein product, partial [Anisakis simplex]|uniref:Btz domain-containing protein n=1 Tax=Anisakis simplex TaxID=6269 RepID=A0A0M3JGR0_ANISI